MKSVWSKDAKADLIEIRRFSARRWGREVTKRYLQDLKDAAKHLAENPDRARPFRGPYTLFKIRTHFLVSRRDDDKDRLVIVRVLHSAMDIERHLPPDPKAPA